MSEKRPSSVKIPVSIITPMVASIMEMVNLHENLSPRKSKPMTAHHIGSVNTNAVAMPEDR